mmetsp:Transcript_49970/g.118904  ORF Transcript_49970/g.118904 Transcript_49970/m.118904 type:complete len:258 (-) Transcript_49970:428-1201(-)
MKTSLATYSSSLTPSTVIILIKQVMLPRRLVTVTVQRRPCTSASSTMRASSSSCMVSPIDFIAMPNSVRSSSPDPSPSNSLKTASVLSQSSSSERLYPSILIIPVRARSQRESSLPMYIALISDWKEGKSRPGLSPPPWSMPASSIMLFTSSSEASTPIATSAWKSSIMSIMPDPSSSNSLNTSLARMGSSNSTSRPAPSFLQIASDAIFHAPCLSLALYMRLSISSNSSIPISPPPSMSMSAAMCVSSSSVRNTLS